MLNGNSKETNKSTTESCTAPQDPERSHKRTLSSVLFSALSGPHRPEWSPDSDAPKDGQTPVRRRSTIRKTRRPRHTPSLSQSVIDTANSQSEQSRMTGLTRYPRSPPPLYQTIPEEDAPPLPFMTHDTRPSPLNTPSTPLAVSEQATFGAAEGSPQPSAPSSIPPHQDNEAYSEPSSHLLPRPPPVFLNHTRRKASMSKLMRHFGETRIPPELFLLSPDQTDTQDLPEEDTPLKKQRTKSLDLRPFAKIQIPESYGTPPRGRQSLQRTRSFGQRASSLSGRRGADETPLAEAAQDRVRRARKITQIFGPELPAGHRPVDEPLALPVLPSMPSPFERASIETNTTTAPYSSDDRDSFVESFADSTRSDEAEHRRRTQKLAKFFGVTQHDISSSVSSEPISPRLSSVVIASPPPFPLQEVEVNVKLAGRRFWGFSSPNRPEYRHADTNDSIVIDQLRTLKAS